MSNAAAPLMTIDEVFNEAIMSKTPILLVEGIDDIKTYTSLARSTQSSAEIYAIETIEGYSAGCKHIIDAVEELYASAEPSHPVENFILGIIDRDVREYRGELPNRAAILTLNYYSIESHFVCRETVDSSVSMFTKVPREDLSADMIEQLFVDASSGLSDMHYFSLEALRAATDSSYQADFKYSMGIGARLQEPTRSNVLNKIAHLDSFAATLGLNKDLSTLRKIASGKWLLLVFCEGLYKVLSDFPGYCGKHGSTQCDFCKAQVNNKCSYKLREGIVAKTLYSTARECINTTHLDYVRDRIRAVPAI